MPFNYSTIELVIGSSRGQKIYKQVKTTGRGRKKTTKKLYVGLDAYITQKKTNLRREKGKNEKRDWGGTPRWERERGKRKYYFIAGL